MWYFTWVYLFDNFAVNIIFSCVLFYLNDLWIKNMDNGGEKICSLELNTSVKTQHINVNLKSNIYTVKLDIRSKILFFIPYFPVVLINVKVLKTWFMLCKSYFFVIGDIIVWDWFDEADLSLCIFLLLLFGFSYLSECGGINYNINILSSLVYTPLSKLCNAHHCCIHTFALSIEIIAKAFRQKLV